MIQNHIMYGLKYAILSKMIFNTFNMISLWYQWYGSCLDIEDNHYHYGDEFICSKWIFLCEILVGLCWMLMVFYHFIFHFSLSLYFFFWFWNVYNLQSNWGNVMWGVWWHSIYWMGCFGVLKNAYGWVFFFVFATAARHPYNVINNKFG